MLLYILDTYVYTKYDPAFWCVYEVDFFLKTSLFVLVCMSVGRMGASTAPMLKYAGKYTCPRNNFQWCKLWGCHMAEVPSSNSLDSGSETV